MRSRLSNLTDRLAYLLRSRGFWGTLQRVFAEVLSPLCKITSHYITMLYFQPGFDVDDKWPDDDDLGTHSVAVESVEELEEFSNEIDDHFDLEVWRDFLTGNSKRFLILARRPREDGTSRVIGMRTCEIGVFSIWKDKPQITLPNDIMVVYDNEVHPQYRGQRVALISRKGLYAYAMKRGVKGVAGFIGTHNLSSIKAHMRGSPMIRPTLQGRVRRVRLFGGLIDWTTPAERIRALIDAQPDDQGM